jgi:hypothetical protein
MMVQCVFPREVWFKSLRRCGWQELALAPDSCFAAWWTFVRKRVHRPCCKAFDSLILAVAWGIWNQSRVFRSSSQCASSVVDTIWSSVGLWCRAVLVDRSHLLALQFTFCLLQVGPLFQIPSFFNAKCAIARSQKKVHLCCNYKISHSIAGKECESNSELSPGTTARKKHSTGYRTTCLSSCWWHKSISNRTFIFYSLYLYIDDHSSYFHHLFFSALSILYSR